MTTEPEPVLAAAHRIMEEQNVSWETGLRIARSMAKLEARRAAPDGEPHYTHEVVDEDGYIEYLAYDKGDADHYAEKNHGNRTFTVREIEGK